jgi:hypothetical protein
MGAFTSNDTSRANCSPRRICCKRQPAWHFRRKEANCSPCSQVLAPFGELFRRLTTAAHATKQGAARNCVQAKARHRPDYFATELHSPANYSVDPPRHAAPAFKLGLAGCGSIVVGCDPKRPWDENDGGPELLRRDSACQQRSHASRRSNKLAAAVKPCRITG